METDTPEEEAGKDFTEMIDSSKVETQVGGDIREKEAEMDTTEIEEKDLSLRAGLEAVEGKEEEAVSLS